MRGRREIGRVMMPEVIPFEAVPGGMAPPPCVSSAKEIIGSQNARSRRRRKANRHMPNMSISSSSNVPGAASSVPDITSNVLVPAPTIIPNNTSVPSAEALTRRVLANAPIDADASSPLYSWSSLIHSLQFDITPIVDDHRPYFDNLSPDSSIFDSDPDFAKIRTPYSAAAFKEYLTKANLIHRYPELCHKLTYGFSLGDLDPIIESFTPPNLQSSDIHHEIIRSYIAEEIILERVVGPFTKEELEAKIGPFRSSPVQVVVTSGGPGQPDKHRCCRNLSYRGKLGRSVNDAIDSDDYPTRWYGAEDCAEIVSLLLIIFIFSSPFYARDTYFKSSLCSLIS